MESVENQTEQLGQAAADAKDIGQLKEDSLKDRLTSIEKSLRDVGRNVQLVRDRQVCDADSSIFNLHLDASTAYKHTSCTELCGCLMTGAGRSTSRTCSTDLC